ncbi:MAG TPA: PDZ domain-containing protein [Pyrinomonadaceae bacterium]|jgi:membrane-associated protease RseP (regulator of RpoE activity)
MQPPDNLNNPSGPPGDSGGIVCSQCGAPMPRGMRFCRACGNRLGEGPAEYTETVRFPNATATGARVTSPYIPPQAAPIAHQDSAGYPYKRRRKLSGMTWVLIIIAIFFVLGSGLSVLRKRVRNAPRISINLNRTYFGVNDFDSVDGGVTFDNVEPPGGPADKAGLVGGDIITSFDGHAISNEDDFRDLLRGTPIGKTVEVTYIRDGETKKTQLTTISEAEFNDLQRAFRSRPEGRGYFGFDDNRTTKISDPQTKTYGVQLDYVEPNRPADVFGLKAGDIITAWDDVPIRTSDELLSRVRRAVPRSTIVITIIRGGQAMKIPVTMGRA